MRTGLIIAFALLLGFPAAVTEADEYDVRELNWRMTREEVIEAEGDDFTENDEERLIYERELLGEPATLGMVFEQDQLLSVVYIVDSDIESRLRRALEERYGEPSRRRIQTTHWTIGDTHIQLEGRFRETRLLYGSNSLLDERQRRRAQEDAEEL